MALENNVDDEKANVEELRNRMKDLMTPEMYKDDNVFQRFLRARNQNIDDAEAMLKNHLNWRGNINVDTIMTEFKPSEVLEKYSTLSRIGFDKDGAPVIYCHFGNMDTKGMYKCGKVSEFNMYLVQLLEENIMAMKEQSLKMGKPIHQWNFVFNYENFALSNATHKPTIEILIGLIAMYDSNYPERLKAAYLINGSFVFTLCWAVLKPFMPGATVQKVRIFGKDGWKEELLKLMDADELPAFLGGNRTDPDGNPRCAKSIRFGGVIPERYYARRGSRKMSVIPDAKRLVVNRLSKAEVKLEVIHPGSTIEWQFHINSKDIDFAVTYKKHRELEAEDKEVVPKQRIEAGLSSESGMLRCDKAGIYALEFDNTYSWLHNKHLWYTVSVKSP